MSGYECQDYDSWDDVSLAAALDLRGIECYGGRADAIKALRTYYEDLENIARSILEEGGDEHA